jgi:urease accessory protein
MRLAVADGASLEWLPQETIVHDGAQAESALEIELSSGARGIGWEITVFGRHASGERFGAGELRQTTRVLRGGRPLFEEASLARGGMGGDPASLAGMHVAGLLWACAEGEIDPALAASAEAAMLAKTEGFAGASRVDSHLLLARVVESSPERARAALCAAWQVLRPALLRRTAHLPRIWAT